MGKEEKNEESREHPPGEDQLRETFGILSEPAASVQVVEHPHFDRLDFELRILLGHQKSAPDQDVLLSFFGRGGTSLKQVVLVYRPQRRLLQRLVLPGEESGETGSRLEIWRDFGTKEMEQLLESAFLEKTRPATLHPEVFLGELESLIDRESL